MDPQPVWAFHGAWLDDARRMVLTDVGAGVLRQYDRDGGAVGTVARPGQGPLDFNRPSAIWSLRSGPLLKDGSRFLWLDEGLAPVRSHDMDDVPVAPGGTVRVLFESAAAKERIFGIGEALLPDETWRSGFFSLPVEDSASYELVRELPLRDRQEFDHYLMGDSHVAVLGGVGYFLAMDDRPFLLEARPGKEPRRLEAFPDGFEERPELPLHSGMTGAEVRYRAYELARLPVGLYGQGDRLYVLTREPNPEADGGGTRWTLTRIDPDADRVEGSVVLPTRAAHLTLIPGPERWAVLEKGRVERYGVQPIPSMLLVPTAWIEASDGSPLAAAVPREELCDGP